MDLNVYVRIITHGLHLKENLWLIVISSESEISGIIYYLRAFFTKTIGDSVA